ncbi:hypothetical protein KLEB273_gp224 [Bacillus phage vB_BauM_KLEB27-3]|nr:hypothetical protein KLEB273_gp224 [Bacillus phage vB_BauM_KLEB27-3]
MSKNINSMLEEMREDNQIYYKLYKSSNPVRFSIVETQWFDELDHDESRFIHDADDNPLKFKTKEKAKEWLLKFIPLSLIDLD